MHVKGLANRYSYWSNRLVEETDLKLYSKVTVNQVIQESKKFSSTSGMVLHYLSLPLKIFHRLVMLGQAHKYGGSCSSFQRAKNIESNLVKISGYLATAKEKLSDEEYNSITTSGRLRSERRLTVVNNGLAQTVVGKCVCETTEIAIYRTRDNQFLAVERGAIHNKLHAAHMLFDPLADDDILFSSFQKTHLSIFKYLCPIMRPFVNTTNSLFKETN